MLLKHRPVNCPKSDIVTTIVATIVAKTDIATTIVAIVVAKADIVTTTFVPLMIDCASQSVHV